MASRQAIAKGLAVMHESFPTRAITENTGDVWFELFREIDDGPFLAAVRKSCIEPGRAFFPTPAELHSYLRPRLAPPDIAGTLRRIEKLGHYDPNRGWVMPRPDDVRQKLGDSIANSYAFVTPARLYSENDTTREIALRDFAESLVAEARREARQIAAPTPTPMLNPGVPVSD